MQREHVIKFLEHARKCQELGVQDAFCFVIYIKKQKQYPSIYCGDRPPTQLRNMTNPKKKKGKGNQNQCPDVDHNKNGAIDPTLLKFDAAMLAERKQKGLENDAAAAVQGDTQRNSLKGKGKAVCPHNKGDEDGSSSVNDSSADSEQEKYGHREYVDG